MLHRLTTWLNRARDLGARLPLHEESLAVLREGLSPGSDGTWELADTEPNGSTIRSASWSRGSARSWIRIQPWALSTTSRSGFGTPIPCGKSPSRATGETWDAAIAAIADQAYCPEYKGLKIAPQLGLVPLGQDSSSGLWEFGYLQTGRLPESCPDELSTLQGAANLADRFCKEESGPAGWQYELGLFDGYSVNARVGSFRANPFGLHDVHGNVWEWCLDYYDLYKFSVREGDGLRLMEKMDEMRVFRGGSHSNVASDVRSAKRDYHKSDSSNFDLGVRPARRLER